MHEIARKVYISSIIFDYEWDFMHGPMRDHAVRFMYRGNDGNESSVIISNYTEALRLALRRALDGRYKNYRFEIDAA